MTSMPVWLCCDGVMVDKGLEIVVMATGAKMVVIAISRREQGELASKTYIPKYIFGGLFQSQIPKYIFAALCTL